MTTTYGDNMNNTRGFTLIEVMVVVVILGILAAIIVPQIMSRPEQAKMVKARQDIMAIENALDLYKLDNGFYPSTDQSLSALVKKPTSSPVPEQWKTGGYLKRLPIDPWNNPYQYLNPGTHSEIDIFSIGPKGSSGEVDSSTVIGNWAMDQTDQAQ
jgi:general secretion pathway protein G